MDLNNLNSDPIVVVGGGFGGLATVQALLAKSDGTPVILIDEGNRFLFKPLLYELLSGELQLWEVAPKYSDLALELGFIFLQEYVVEIDEIEQKLITSSEIEITYSQLVVSTGVTTDYSLLEKLEDYAFGFSNLNDFRILKKLITKINNSTESTNPIVIAGAGPTGVELACKISDLIKDRIQIYLVDKGDKILPNCKSFNRDKAIDAIGQRNIRVYLDCSIKSVDKTFLELSSTDNETNDFIKIDYSTLLWTAGLKPSKSKFVYNFLNENEKIKVNEFMQMDEYPNIFFVGDITFYEKAPFPSSAQVAMQQGSLVAQNIISLRKGNARKPFEFEDLGEMLSLGIGNASITGYGITLAGPLAFKIRRFAYLMRMPGFLLSFKSSGSCLFSKKIINHLFSQSL
jgi:NADH dehydrogenase